MLEQFNIPLLIIFSLTLFSWNIPSQKQKIPSQAWANFLAEYFVIDNTPPIRPDYTKEQYTMCYRNEHIFIGANFSPKINCENTYGIPYCEIIYERQ